MQGKRIYLNDDAFLPQSGEYGIFNNIWFACTPNGLLGNLASHDVIEHEDGAITVSPSILVTSRNSGGEVAWHGYLEHGVWREV
jgi:hypothetical protein